MLLQTSNIETVKLKEKLLSGGYSSVHTKIEFDTEMLTLKSKEYFKEHLSQKDKIVDDLRNIYGEPDEKSQRKVLMQNLIDLRNNPHKVLFTLHLDIEEQSQPRRVFSKIFKLNENNQKAFNMTKSVQVRIFKKKPFAELDILNKTVNDFGPNSKTGHVFIVFNNLTIQ